LKARTSSSGTAISDRNRLADKLSRDNQRLADAQKKLADEAAAVKGAITGSFDVTTAGTGFDGNQPITGKNMLAEEKQAATRARVFVAAIKKLKGKIGAGYLYQLAEKGPSALPEAQALLSLNKSDLSAFNAANRVAEHVRRRPRSLHRRDAVRSRGGPRQGHRQGGQASPQGREPARRPAR
jgi:hypothetical protein